MKPKYEFETKIWIFRAKYRTFVRVFDDRVVIERFGRTGNLPKESTVFFRDISGILYGCAGRYTWIRFVVPNIVTAVKPNLYAIDNWESLHIDPYAVIFSAKQKQEAMVHYGKIQELFVAYKAVPHK